MLLNTQWEARIVLFSKELAYVRQVGPGGKEETKWFAQSVASQGQKLNPDPSSLMSLPLKSFSSMLSYGLFEASHLPIIVIIYYLMLSENVIVPAFKPYYCLLSPRQTKPNQ